MGVGFAWYFLLKRTASKVNTYTIEKKIAENTSYAKYIAEVYPNWTWRYIELNPEYDEYGDDIPFVDFYPNRQRNSVIVQIIGLSVLFVIWGAFIIWLVYLHNKYGI